MDRGRRRFFDDRRFFVDLDFDLDLRDDRFFAFDVAVDVDLFFLSERALDRRFDLDFGDNRDCDDPAGATATEGRREITGDDIDRDNGERTE